MEQAVEKLQSAIVHPVPALDHRVASVTSLLRCHRELRYRFGSRDLKMPDLERSITLLLGGRAVALGAAMVIFTVAVAFSRRGEELEARSTDRRYGFWKPIRYVIGLRHCHEKSTQCSENVYSAHSQTRCLAGA